MPARPAPAPEPASSPTSLGTLGPEVGAPLDAAHGHATLEVADDGVGFEPSHQEADDYGLAGMRERAERLGGLLQVESVPGAGTRVRVEAPR